MQKITLHPWSDRQGPQSGRVLCFFVAWLSGHECHESGRHAIGRLRPRVLRTRGNAVHGDQQSSQ